MCTFSSTLPTKFAGQLGSNKKTSISMFIKPNDPNNSKDRYRVRLLNFYQHGKNNRSYPFIPRWEHIHWGKTEAGKPIPDDMVVCPASSSFKGVGAVEDARNDPSLGFTEVYNELSKQNKKATWDNVCPVCRHAQMAFNAWKASGWKDQISKKKYMQLRRSFSADIPVFCLVDNVNLDKDGVSRNAGKLRVLHLTNKDDYDNLNNLIQTEIAKIEGAKKAGKPYDWCNGTNAVDLYIRMEVVPQLFNAGKPNQYTANVKKITEMYFGSNPYTLIDNTTGVEIINKTAIDNFEFDEQFYHGNTRNELVDFYEKHFNVATSNIPDDEDPHSENVVSAPVTSQVSAPSASAAPSTVNVTAPVKQQTVNVDDLNSVIENQHHDPVESDVTTDSDNDLDADFPPDPPAGSGSVDEFPDDSTDFMSGIKFDN